MAAINLANPANLPDDVAQMLMDLGVNTRERISAPDEGVPAGQAAAIRARAQRDLANRQAGGLAAWNSMCPVFTCLTSLTRLRYWGG